MTKHRIDERELGRVAASGTRLGPRAGLSGSDVPPGVRLRLDFVDGIRAAAAIYVVLHHIWLTIYPSYHSDPGPVPLRWLAYGHVAVAVFIVVSGFSLGIAPSRGGMRLRGGFGTFMKRRAWRILPTYWAALALSCLVFGVITPELTGDRVSIKAIIVHGLLVQDVIDSPRPNGVFWSIAVEWQLYFLFPLLVLLLRTAGAMRLALAAAAVTVTGYLLATNVTALAPFLNLTPQFGVLFVLGLVAARAVDPRAHVVGRKWGPLGAGGVGVILVITCSVTSIQWVERQYFWIDLEVGAATALLLVGLASGAAAGLGRVLAGRTMSSVGLFSYSIYCVHLPLLWLVWHFGVDGTALSQIGKFWVLLAVGAPLAVGGAYLFSLLFERPFLAHRSARSLVDWLLRRKLSVPPNMSR